MVGNWRVIAGPPICDQNSCCCFTSDVNIFATPGSGELNLNGTVAGTYCNQPIRQDNINPPASLSFTEEFFGINNYTFTLANASSAGQGLRLTAIDNNSGFSRCSFVMYCATCDFILPGYTLPAAAPPPSVAQPYVGDWAFDTSTCDANSCCCMTGNATVFVDPDGAPTLHISSSGSAGCPVSDSIEDDFPFPSSGTATSSFSVAQGFLPNQDTFNISLLASNTNFILSFTDETAPACSMRATRPMPVSSSPIVFGRSASITGVDDVDGLAIEAAYSYWVNWTNNVRGGIRIDGVRHPVKLIQYNVSSMRVHLRALVFTVKIPHFYCEYVYAYVPAHPHTPHCRRRTPATRRSSPSYTTTSPSSITSRRCSRPSPRPSSLRPRAMRRGCRSCWRARPPTRCSARTPTPSAWGLRPV